MSQWLFGRYGPYKPRVPADRRKAERIAQARRQADNLAAAWLERNRWCVAGCGKEAAFYPDTPVKSLQFDGACSAECQAAHAKARGRP
mgnify:CR=1 FL=1